MVNNMEEEIIEQAELKKQSDKKEKNKKSILGLVLIVLLFTLLLVPSRKPSIFKKSNYNKMENICEYATLELIYHQTGIFEHKGKILDIGYKKYWLEYEGKAKVGINCKNVKIKTNILGKTIVTIPKAEVLSVDIDEETIKELSDTGLFAKIKTDDKEQAKVNAQKTLRENAEKDKENLQLTQKLFEKQIRSYIEDDKFYNMFHKVEFVYE